MTSFVYAKYGPDTTAIVDPTAVTPTVKFATDPLTGMVAGLVNPAGGVISIGISLAAGVANASANAATLQVVLASGGLVSINTPGTYYSNPFKMPSGSTISLGAGVVLKRADSVNAPLIRNKFGGQKNTATRFNRASNVVTVNNQYHGLTVGDQVWVGTDLTDTTMSGIQTVASTPDAHTWTYASTGSNGAGGSSSVFGSIIPLRRTIAGASFVSASNVVTVSDPGHDLRPGFNVWLGTTGASTAFCGLVEVIAVWPDSWQYVTTASGTASASGTIAISYDYDINITGDGRIDGSALTNSSPADVNLMASLVVFGALNQSKISIKRAGSTIFRVLNFFNCADVTVDGVELGDTLVGVQFEGSAKRCALLNSKGSTAKWVSGAQLVDDFVAFTGTNIAGAAYDSTASPYGLGAFYNCKVSKLDAVNCLNGIKQTGYSTVTFDEMVYEDIEGGMLNNNVTPLGGSTAAVRMVDDTAGLVGMVCGNIYIKRVNWFGGANAVLWATNGSAKMIDIDGVNYAPNAQQITANTTAVAWIQGGASTTGRINRLMIRNFTNVASSAAKPGIVLGNGNVKTTQTVTIDDLMIENATITVGGSNSSGAGVLKYGNCVVTAALVRNSTLYGPVSGTGHGMVCIGPTSMGRWTWENVRVAAGGASMSFAFTVLNGDASDTVAAGEIVFRGCDISSISGIYDNATNWTGTLTVRASDSRMTFTGNLFNLASATGLTQFFASPTVSTTVDKVIGTAAGTLRVNGPSIQLVGSKVTAQQPGDIFWSTDTSTTGSASIGMKARTAAGAWAALF